MPSVLAALAADGLSQSDKLEWWFRYLAPDPRTSYRFTQRFPEIACVAERALGISSGPEHELPDGRKRLSVIVSLVVKEPLSHAQAETILDTVLPIAQELGVQLLGIGCQRTPTEPGYTRWLTLNHAIWLMRHYMDTGQFGPMDYVFGFSGEGLDRVAATLSALGMATWFHTDDHGADEHAGTPRPPLLLARIGSDGSDEDMTSRHTQAAEAASAAGADFLGMTLEGLDPEDPVDGL